MRVSKETDARVDSQSCKPTTGSDAGEGGVTPPTASDNQVSPLPWAYCVEPSTGLYPGVEDADGRLVAEMAKDIYRPDIRETNAAYIVRACNSFPELLAALTQIHKLADSVEDAHEMRVRVRTLAREAMKLAEANHGRS
jgi:hypothetical protein